MNLNQLYYFKVLSQYEHYTLASKELFISQPSLTYAIKELEKELGLPLFDKVGRNIKLNEHGKIFLQYVNQSLSILDKGVDILKNRGKDQLQVINMSVIPTVVNTFLAPIMMTMKKTHPSLQIQFRSERTLDIIQGVEDLTYDFGICSKLENNHLIYLPLLHEELILITCKDHPLSKLKNVTFQDIAQYPLVTYQKEISIYSTVMDLFHEQQLNPQVLYELDDESSIGSMVSRGFGVAIVANNELLKPFNDIERIPLPIESDTRTIYLVYNPQHQLSKVASEFIDYLIAQHMKLK